MPPAAGKREDGKDEAPPVNLVSFMITVCMSTFLFLTIFMSGSAWTMAANKRFEGRLDSNKYFIFALCMTLFTIALACVFAVIANATRSTLSINVNSFIGV